MHRSRDKKNRLFIYLSLLLLLSTFNNLSLSNSNYLDLKIYKVEVAGLNNEKNNEITKQLKSLLFHNILFIDKQFLRDILDKNNLIHSFDVKKIYPDSIEIRIKKTKFLAITNYNNKKFYIGSNGKLINFDSKEKKLPYAYGKFDINIFLEIKGIIDKSKFDYSEISEIFFFPSGRIDIKNNYGQLFKFPKKNLLEYLNLAKKIQNNKNLKKNDIFDLRISKYIILTNE